MILFKTIEQLQQHLSKNRNNNQSIGFVPTMGALHQGHLSLINLSKKSDLITVCSIFINPTQFNDSNDFNKYPITIEQDILLLEKAGCDILFLPSVQEMYPNGTNLQLAYNLGYLETILEGKYRPGHFQGVCQIVHRLLGIVQPNQLFLGQKDYQQCMVIKKMIALMGLEKSINVNIANTLREISGLAMSSRNVRLSDAGKDKATAIYQALHFIKNNINSSPILLLQEKAKALLLENGFDTIDYIAICDASTLQPLENVNQSTSLVVLIAAFLEGVRLIDNLHFAV